LLVAPLAEKYPATLVEVVPVAVTSEYVPYLVTEAEALAPEAAIFKILFDVDPAVEDELKFKTFPVVNPLAVICKASAVVTLFAVIEAASVVVPVLVKLIPPDPARISVCAAPVLSPKVKVFPAPGETVAAGIVVEKLGTPELSVTNTELFADVNPPTTLFALEYNN
jgi:hypothetical protein